MIQLVNMWYSKQSTFFVYTKIFATALFIIDMGTDLSYLTQPFINEYLRAFAAVVFLGPFLYNIINVCCLKRDGEEAYLFNTWQKKVIMCFCKIVNHDWVF